MSREHSQTQLLTLRFSAWSAALYCGADARLGLGREVAGRLELSKRHFG